MGLNIESIYFYIDIVRFLLREEKEHNSGYFRKYVACGERVLIHIGWCILYRPILALKVEVNLIFIFHFHFLVTLFYKLYISHDFISSSVSLFIEDSKVLR